MARPVFPVEIQSALLSEGPPQSAACPAIRLRVFCTPSRRWQFVFRHKYLRAYSACRWMIYTQCSRCWPHIPGTGDNGRCTARRPRATRARLWEPTAAFTRTMRCWRSMRRRLRMMSSSRTASCGPLQAFIAGARLPPTGECTRILLAVPLYRAEAGILRMG
jgi:hypothetical protein